MIQWLDDFYGDPELRSTLLESFLPVFSNYIAEATGGPVAASFVQAIATSYIERHLGSSRAQLQEVIDGADDPLSALTERFTEWEEKRPGKVARNELVRAANAAQVERMREQGVTRKVWRSSGGSCPYCTGLNGRTISIEEAFFTPDDEYSPEGAEGPLTFTSKIGHPPVHQGCDCSIEAYVETRTVEEAVAGLEEGADPDYWRSQDITPDHIGRIATSRRATRNFVASRYGIELDDVTGVVDWTDEHSAGLMRSLERIRGISPESVVDSASFRRILVVDDLETINEHALAVYRGHENAVVVSKVTLRHSVGREMRFADDMWDEILTHEIGHSVQHRVIQSSLYDEWFPLRDRSRVWDTGAQKYDPDFIESLQESRAAAQKTLDEWASHPASSSDQRVYNRWYNNTPEEERQALFDSVNIAKEEIKLTQGVADMLDAANYDGEWFPTEYAATNISEDVAESFAMFITKPDLLRERSPSRYDLIVRALQ